MAIQDNMNLPPNGTSLSGNIAKSTTFMERFNGVLAKTLDMTNKISKNMGFTGGGTGAGGGNLTTSGNFTGGQSGGGMGTMASLGTTIGRIGTFALGATSAAAQAMPGVQDTLNTQLLTSQARFSGMQGNVGAQIRGAMNAGTTNSPYDAIQAVSQGTAAGLIPALPGYSGIMNGVAQISNLTGNMQSAMAATSALNQGSSVNRLRMFGINVRNAQGTMRNPSEIFKDIYNFANQQSGKRLTKQDVAIGMQSGNGLANFMDFVSGGDSNLRGALQTAALQYSQGGDLSKASLTQTGQLTAASNASSALNAGKFGLTEAAAPAISAGYVEGAALLTKFNDNLANVVTNSKLASDALKQLSKVETISADNLGQAGTGLMALLGSAIGGGGLLGKLGSGGGKVGNLFGNLFKAVGAGGASYFSSGVVEKSGFGGDNLLLKELGILGAGTATGAAVGGGPGALIGALMSIPSMLHAASGTKGSTGLGGGASTSTSASSLGASSNYGSLVVGIASTQLGVPYSWGGGNNNGPTPGMGSGKNTVGFDCSSFTRFVMSKAGVILPRTAHEQEKCGIKINPKDAQPGDLLFWSDGGGPAHHVAIYVGGGMMIQAPQTGGNVERVSVNLDGVSSCSRVLDGATGTASIGNLLDSAGGDVLSKGTSSIAGLSSNTPSGNVNIFNVRDLKGYSAESAMSGGVVTGSGLGLGSSTSSYQSANTNKMAQQYLYINSKTGALETSSNGGQANVINYGGVTISVDTKGANLTAKDIGKAVKEELRNIGINAKVVGK